MTKIRKQKTTKNKHTTKQNKKQSTTNTKLQSVAQEQPITDLPITALPIIALPITAKNKQHNTTTNTINTTEESITQLDNATTSTTTPEQESAAQTPNTTNTNYPLVLTDINKNIVHKSGYTWGLGIEHEFTPVIKIKTFSEYATLYKILNNVELDENTDNIIELKKEMNKINNVFYVFIQHSIIYSEFGNFYKNKLFPYANIEYTGLHHFPMLETKNLHYKNTTLQNVLLELNKNTKALLTHFNDAMTTKYNMHYKNTIFKNGFGEPDAGSVLYIYNYNYNYNDNTTSDKTHKLAVDTAGSYHFWITLPHKDINNLKSTSTHTPVSERSLLLKKQALTNYNKILHQKAAYLLQTIEPLLIAVYCSPDPRVSKPNKDNKTNKINKNNIKLCKGSFRGAVNNYANYGTSLLQNYDNKILFSRQMAIKNLQHPTQIGSQHYINQIRNTYNKTRKNKNVSSVYNNKLVATKTRIKPKYLYLNNNFNTHKIRDAYYYNYYNSKPKSDNTAIGLNIRRRPDIPGFEFRILDHIPEVEMPNIVKIIYMFACMAYENKKCNHSSSGASKDSSDCNNLELAASNSGWHNMITNALFDGYKCNVDKTYVKFLEKQFNITLDIPNNKYKHDTHEKHTSNTYFTSITLLEQLIDKCWVVLSANKNNGLWLLLEDEGKQPLKPLVISKNKELLDKII